MELGLKVAREMGADLLPGGPPTMMSDNFSEFQHEYPGIDVYKRQGQIFDIIKELHATGTTILLVEQNAEMALKVADRAYVLESGTIKLSGTGAELAASDEIKKAYLGG